MSVDATIAKLRAAKARFEDPDFPAAAQSLYRKAAAYNPAGARIQSWLRPDGFCPDQPVFFKDGVHPGDVIQGGLGDCWALSALNVVAARPELLKHLVVRQEPDVGLYQFRFFRQGEWVLVTIDDRLPCLGNFSLAYASCRDPNEIWVPLLEKAFAKFYGCYENLNGGSIAQALVDLTGGVSIKIHLENEDVRKEIQRGQLWDRMCTYLEQGFLMGCTFSVIGTPEASSKLGILQNHGYGIMDMRVLSTGQRLIRLRNPWGATEWKGPWADHSAQWEKPLQRELDYKFADDGTFWMAWRDFLVQFNKIHVCHLYEDSIGKVWSKATTKGEWKGISAAGCQNYSTWLLNPQFGVEVKATTQAFISVSQPDIRPTPGKKFAAIGFYVVRTRAPFERVTAAAPSDVIFSSPFITTRDVARKVILEAGYSYVIVPCTFKSGVELPFFVRVFSEEDIELAPVRDRKGTEIAGHWVDASAGGCPNFPSWRTNPQYKVTLSRPQPFSIRLEQGAPAPGKIWSNIGFQVVAMSRPGRLLSLSGEDVVAQSDYVADKFVQTEVDNPNGATEFLVVPSTFNPKKIGQFVLTVFCDDPVEVELVVTRAQVEIEGRWVGDIAGGCPNNLTWKNNPQFEFATTVSETVTVSLEQTGGDPHNIGFLVATTADHKKLKGWSQGAIVAETPYEQSFVHTDVDVKGGQQYVIVPSTFHADRKGTFRLVVRGSSGMKMIPLPL